LTAALKRWRWSGEKSKMKSPVNLSLIASTGGNARDVRRAKGIGVSKVRYEPALIAVNPFIGMNLGRYCTQWRSALLTSATLAITNTPEGGMEWLCKTLALNDDMVSIKRIFAPESYGTMTLTIAGAAFPKVFSDPKEQSFPVNGLLQSLTSYPACLAPSWC
jgi:hypothetical protein